MLPDPPNPAPAPVPRTQAASQHVSMWMWVAFPDVQSNLTRPLEASQACRQGWIEIVFDS